VHQYRTIVFKNKVSAFSHSLALFPNQWKEILGKELNSKIANIKKPNIIKKVGQYKC
jgi:hypothetical protein